MGVFIGNQLDALDDLGDEEKMVVVVAIRRCELR